MAEDLGAEEHSSCWAGVVGVPPCWALVEEGHSDSEEVVVGLLLQTDQAEVGAVQVGAVLLYIDLDEVEVDLLLLPQRVEVVDPGCRIVVRVALEIAAGVLSNESCYCFASLEVEEVE